MNDNDKAPEHIRALLGKAVLVRDPTGGCRWKGRLAEYHEGPVIVLSGASYAGTGGGMNEGNLVFPAGWHVRERQVPPPPEPCPHCGQVPLNLGFLNFG